MKRNNIDKRIATLSFEGAYSPWRKFPGRREDLRRLHEIEIAHRVGGRIKLRHFLDEVCDYCSEGEKRNV